MGGDSRGQGERTKVKATKTSGRTPVRHKIPLAILIFLVWPTIIISHWQQQYVTCYSGIAIHKDGLIYIADGANIRTIDDGGRIQTIIGSQDQPKHWLPPSCHRPINASEVGVSVLCGSIDIFPTTKQIQPSCSELNCTFLYHRL